MSVKAGDRVAWRNNPSVTGIIREIRLSDHPFLVCWETGYDDSYKGNDLLVLKPDTDAPPTAPRQKTDQPS
jgi:hypothetical protein